MTDILTKEERELFEKVKARISDIGEFINADSDLIALCTIIDNLSKRGVKKHSEEELRNFAKDSGISYKSFSAYFEGVTDFARYIGALEEK